MGRILRQESPARERAGLLAAARAALADLGLPAESETLRDRLAFAGLAMRELQRSTERTAEAWERRGYWLKADQFRREWGWAAPGAEAILGPLLRGDIDAARAAGTGLLGRLAAQAGADAPKAALRWAGAYDRLRSEAHSNRRT